MEAMEAMVEAMAVAPPGGVDTTAPLAGPPGVGGALGVVGGAPLGEAADHLRAQGRPQVSFALRKSVAIILSVGCCTGFGGTSRR